MKKIFGIIKISLQCSMAYKIKLIFYAAQSFLQFFIFYYLWKNAFSTQSEISGYNVNQMITYLTASFLLQCMIPKWITMEIGWKTKSGELITDLLRPIKYSKYLLFFSFGDVVFTMLFCGIPVILMGAFSGHLIGSAAPLLSLLAVILSYMIAYLLHYIVGLISFWTNSIWGIFLAFNIISTFCAGGILPIEFMPHFVQIILNILPFPYLISEPLMIYLGKSENPLFVIFIQVVWIIVLKLLSEILYNIGSRRLEIAGG